MLNLLGLSILLTPSQTLAPYQNGSLSAEVRARDLVERMTTDEKIRQLMMDAPAIPRLGVPRYHWWNEALHGVARAGTATVYPQAIGLAATWDTDLMFRVATAISVEARAKYQESQRRREYGIYQGLTLWSPNVNIFRDPRWGRGHETYGEDPFLTGRMGVAFVKGIQGNDPKYLRAVATPKHFAVHSGPEPLRHKFDAKTPERDIFETYLPAFEACVREGKAQSVMAAYSGFNGVPATGNPWLLTDLLRHQWGFDGAVVSDVDSVHDLWADHKVVKDAAEASAMALKAGDDLCSGDTYRGLPEALRRGLIQEEDLNRAATRLFTLRMRLGMFDAPDKVAYQSTPTSEIDSLTHDALAKEAASKSLVLLKNDGVLPLNARKLRRVAVIGPVADDQDTLLGNYNGTPSRPSTILKGLRDRLSPKGVAVDYARGSVLAGGLTLGALPFPDGTLFTDSSRSTPGLKGEVFSGRSFEGNPIATRVDKSIDYQWSADQGPAGIPARNVAIRWTGVFVPKESGTTTLGLSADDGVRLYLDDKLVIDDWKENAERGHRLAIPVKSGEPIRVRLEFFQAGGGAAIRFGYTPIDAERKLREEAIAIAGQADVVILTLGITPNLEGEEMPVNADGFQGGDRIAIDLPAPQRELMNAITKLGKPVVLVLTGGSSLAFDTTKPNAALFQWYSGQRGGDAVAAALFGDVNPSGRLPVTFYRSAADLPPFESYAMAGRTYRYFDGKPLFPFGFGLSYSKFSYGKAKALSTSDGFRVLIPVKGDLSVSGEEVVQVYAHPMKRSSGDAIKSLVGFVRVPLKAGERKVGVVDIPKSRLRVWNSVAKRYEVRPGAYELLIGPSSSQVSARVSLKIED